MWPYAISQRATSTHADSLTGRSDQRLHRSVEMRHSVTTPIYRLRKWIDGFLASFAPAVPWPSLIPILSQTAFPPGAAKGWLSLYTMVTFRPDISYATAQRKARDQARMITQAGILFTALVLLLFAFLFQYLFNLYL